MVDGVAVTAVARTARRRCAHRGFEEAVAVLDAALHRHLVTSAALAAALDRMAGWPGAPRARRAVEFADPRPMSVGESRSRVAMARFGVAHAGARSGQVVGAGRRRARHRRLRWPEHGVAGEFDGFVKYGRLLRPGQVPADVGVRREAA